MMNLRYLVVPMDPKSRTSPAPVLDRWRDRITIVEWTHTSNFSNGDYEVDEAQFGPNDTARLINHRTNAKVHRQIDFYQACAFHLKSRNRTLTSFIDLDEFVAIPPRANVSREAIRQEPGIIFKMFQEYSSSRQQYSPVNASAEVNASATATAILQSARARAVRHEIPHPSNLTDSSKDWNLWFSALPCVTVQRTMFGTVPSSDENVSRDVPDYLDARRFNTLNFLYQAKPDPPAKSLIDLSRIPWDAKEYMGSTSPHRPFGDWCSNGWIRTDSFALDIHHYLGSWEQFSYRNDARKGSERRSIDMWKKDSAMQEGGLNDDARPWISGFVKLVGDEAAKELLRGAGLLQEDQKKSENAIDRYFLRGCRV
jgi:hypothetical protein